MLAEVARFRCKKDVTAKGQRKSPVTTKGETAMSRAPPGKDEVDTLGEQLRRGGKFGQRRLRSVEKEARQAERNSQKEESDMKKTIMFFTGVALCKVLLPGGESFAGESSNRTELKAAVQERVLEANRTFQETIAAFPEQEHAVTVSFTRSLPLKKALEKAIARGLQIEGFRVID
jgi:hypothetical protein